MKIVGKYPLIKVPSLFIYLSSIPRPSLSPTSFPFCHLPSPCTLTISISLFCLFDTHFMFIFLPFPPLNTFPFLSFLPCLDTPLISSSLPSPLHHRTLSSLSASSIHTLFFFPHSPSTRLLFFTHHPQRGTHHHREARTTPGKTPKIN